MRLAKGRTFKELSAHNPVEKNSDILHRTCLIFTTFASSAHLASFRLLTLHSGRAQNFHLHLVSNLIDLAVNRQHCRSQHAVARESVVQEVNKQQDLNDTGDPRLNVRVMWHLYLLVDPVQRVEHPVTTKGDDVEVDTPVFLPLLPVAEYVLRHHCEALEEFGKCPRHFQNGVFASEHN